MDMSRRVLHSLKRFVLWDYPRACWQYDVMVGLILAFIFLTPRDWFRDQPRVPGIVMLQKHAQTQVFLIEPELLVEVAEPERQSKVAELLKKKTGKQANLVRLEPIFDSESEIKGYVALVKP
jgi:hypothetical protein